MKKLLSIILCVLMIASIVPVFILPVEAASYTTPSTIGPDTVEKRISELRNKLEGKYFTTNQKADSDYDCDYCFNTNIITKSWFKTMFSSKRPSSTNQFPIHYTSSGYITQQAWSCAGFGNFAMWYIFASKSTDDVNVKKIGTISSTKANFTAKAKVGDILRSSEHTAIFLSAESNGIKVLQSNWGNSNKVTVGTIPYSYYSKWTISRATNYDVNMSSTPTLTMYYSANGGTVAASSKYKVSADGLGLNMRSSASISSSVLLTVPDGTILTVTTTKSADGYTWGKTTYNGKTGWCALGSGFTVRQGYYASSDIIYSYTNSKKVSLVWDYGKGGSNGLYNASTFGLTRDGYKFVGWCTKADGSATIFDQNDVNVKAENIVPDVATASKTVTLYAIWEEIIEEHIHTEIAVSGYAATCTSSGLTDGTKCSECGEVLVEQLEIEPVEHTYGDWVIDSAAGIQTKTCSVCGDTVTEEYSIIGNWNNDGAITWTLDNNGTLTVSGSGDMQGYSIGKSPIKYYENKIKSVIISDGITKIGARAFRDMTYLKSVTLGKDVTEISYEAFLGCSSLTDVSLNEGLEIIGSFAFSGTPISQISLPSTLTKLDNRVFKDCKNLNNVVLPDSVTYTGYELFMNCTSLSNFKWSVGCSWFNSLTFAGCTALTEITVSKTVVHVKSNAFRNCTGLVSIDFEDSDTLVYTTKDLPALASNAFDGCNASMVVKGWTGTAVETVAKNAGITFEKKNSTNFKYTVNADGVSCTITGMRGSSAGARIPETIDGYTVTAIGAGAFRNNKNLTSVTLNENLKTIGGRAFENCTGITYIHIPANVTKIDYNAFAGCSNLASVTFKGTALSTINTSAFQNCTALRTLKNFNLLSVAVAKNAFSGTALTSLTVGSGTTFSGNPFSGLESTLTINCPISSDAYRFATEKGFNFTITA